MWIGRSVVLLKEFGIDGYGGVDISQNAINEAINFGKYFGYDLRGGVNVYDGNKISFEYKYFDFTILEGVNR